MLPHFASSTPKSSSVTQSSNLDDREAITRTDKLERMPIIADPASERMAFDYQQYPEIYRGLLGYLDGTRIKVTYLQNLDSNIGDARTTNADMELDASAIHKAYRAIFDYEITVAGGVSFEFVSDKAYTNMDWEVYLYPGFTPIIGDIVFMPIGDNKIAYMRVKDAQPMSWFSDSVWRVELSFVSYPSRSDILHILDTMPIRMVFSKDAYLGGAKTLLTEESYLALEKMASLKKVLTRHYFKQFFSTAYNSFFAPSGIYDPYVTKFMMGITEFSDTYKRPIQLWPRVTEKFDQTIWGRLADRFNYDINDLLYHTKSVQYDITSFNVGMTPLINRNFIDLYEGEDTDTYPGYVFTESFYSGKSDTMTPLESFCFEAITTRKIADFSGLLNIINTYSKLTPSDQFYRIPLYMYLMRVAENSITRVL